MSYTSDLALAKQAFDDLVAFCAPEAVQAWHPSDAQRARYLSLGERVLDGVGRLEAFEQHRLWGEGQFHSVIPDSLLAFLREQIKPRADRIRAALDYIDPAGKDWRDFFHGLGPAGRPHGGDGRVRHTFEVGLDKVVELLENNPGWFDDDDGIPAFLPDLAYDVLDSKLIKFEPDAWLDRSGDLHPIRTYKSNFRLPSHVRLRFEELCRAYVFGLWLSVLGLSRAILEYAILDNLSKLEIERTWPPGRDGSRKEKKLSHLIDEVAERLPQNESAMTFLRDCGNEYLHPKKSKLSKVSLFQRQNAAKEVVPVLIEVVEALYDFRKEA